MKPKNKHQYYPRAFSLIDVVFSMVFLTVIVLGVVKLQTSNLALSNTQNSTARAYELANQALEIVEAIGQVDIAVSCPDGDPFPCERYLQTAADPYTLSDDAVSFKGVIVGTMTFDRTIEIRRLGIEGGAITDNPADPLTPTNGYHVTTLIEWEDSAGEHAIEAERIVYE